MSVGALRLGSFVFLLVVFHDVHVVGREHRYLEAEVFSSCGGLVSRVRRRAWA